MFMVLVVLAWLAAVLWLVLSIAQTTLDFTVLTDCAIPVNNQGAQC